MRFKEEEIEEYLEARMFIGYYELGILELVLYRKPYKYFQGNLISGH